MLFSFFFSIALAAVPSSAGVSVSPVKEAVKSEAVFGPVDERPVTKSILEKSIEKFSCAPYAPKQVSEEKEVKKSDVAREVYDILASKNVTFPADTATMRFYDLNEKDSTFEAAQGLAALGIMGAEEGRFADGQMKSFELNRLMEQAFSSECGLVPDDDPDGDNVEGEADICPLVPGSLNGCPDVSFRPRKEGGENQSRPYLRVPLSAESDGFLFHEKIDIQEGDLFRAVIRSPKTGENLSESAPLEVK